MANRCLSPPQDGPVGQTVGVSVRGWRRQPCQRLHLLHAAGIEFTNAFCKLAGGIKTKSKFDNKILYAAHCKMFFDLSFSLQACFNLLFPPSLPLSPSPQLRQLEMTLSSFVLTTATSVVSTASSSPPCMTVAGRPTVASDSLQLWWTVSTPPLAGRMISETPSTSLHLSAMSSPASPASSLTGILYCGPV